MREQSAQIIPGEKTGEMPQPMQATRRGLLKGILGAISALGLGSFLYGIYRYLAPGAGEGEPVEIALSSIPSGGAVFFQYGGVPGILLRGEGDTQ
jgi:hypothetical protein